MQQIAHGAVPMYMRVQPCKKAAPARHAYRILAVRLPEGYPFLQCHMVQKRRLCCRISHVGHGVMAHFIRVEYDNMWSFFHLASPFQILCLKSFISRPQPHSAFPSSALPMASLRMAAFSVPDFPAPECPDTATSLPYHHNRISSECVAAASPIAHVP